MPLGRNVWPTPMSRPLFLTPMLRNLSLFATGEIETSKKKNQS
jgi:hypothetical protein